MKLAKAVTTIPIWLILAAVVSPLLPGRWRPLRLLCFGLAWLVLEALAILALSALWVASGFGLSWAARRTSCSDFEVCFPVAVAIHPPGAASARVQPRRFR